jgi:hypothetical protein
MPEFDELKRAASQGDPDALYALGLSYQEEAFRSKNGDMLSNVAYLFDRAANKGHVEAMWRLAKLHSQSREVFRDADPRFAIDLFEKLLQKEPDAFGVKIALGEMYCTAGKMYLTSVGFMLPKEGYILPDGSKLKRNVSKGLKLIEDVVQNVDIATIDFYNIQTLCQIYAGGWLRDDCKPTIDDTIQAIKLCNKTIDLAVIENQEKHIIEASKHQLDYLKKLVKTEWDESKSSQNLKIPTGNVIIGEESLLDKLKANGLEDMANVFEQELKKEQERQERTRECNKLAEKAKEAAYEQLLQTKAQADKKVEPDTVEYRKLASQFLEFDVYTKSGSIMGSGYKDAPKLAKECESKAREQEQKIKYVDIVSRMVKASSEADFRVLADKFRSMGNYQDAIVKAKECENEARRLQSERWVSQGLCQYDGGEIGGLFTKKCKNCGRAR